MQHHYVSDAVWLPTYFRIAALALGGISNSAIAPAAVLIALLSCRLILELIYRFVFGNSRLQWRVGVLAFVAQLAAWGLFWLRHAQEGIA